MNSYDKHINDLEIALDDRAKVRGLNRPTLLKNRKIRDKNREIKARNQEIEENWAGAKKDAPTLATIKTLKKPYSIKPSSRKIIEAERSIRETLRNKKPEEWARDVKKIKDKALRTRVACIVWWDYVSDRKYKDRQTHLDEYLNKPYIKVGSKLIAKGLHQCGYSPVMAESRVVVTEDDDCEIKEEAV